MVTLGRSELDYCFEETPSWRNHENTTSKLVVEITRFRNKYEKDVAPKDDLKRFCECDFAQAMAVDYICDLNNGELVGTRARSDTEDALKYLLLPGSDMIDIDVQQRESINTFKAMKKFYEIWKDAMDGSGLLTVEQICEVHEVLMDKLMENFKTKPGALRDTDVYTRTEKGLHFYPEPKRAKLLLYASIDHHNLYMTCLKNKYSQDTNDYTALLFKCAARLLFSFVDAHPFGDGNGRMCRLLANYVLSQITIFPVGLYHKSRPERSGRDDYIEAIIHCREHPEEGPGKLASMLVESAWHGWKELFKNVGHRVRTLSYIRPILVQLSDPEKTKRRISSIITDEHLNVDEEDIVKRIERIKTEVDTAVLPPFYFLEKEFEHKGINFRCHIFN